MRTAGRRRRSIEKEMEQPTTMDPQRRERLEARVDDYLESKMIGDNPEIPLEFESPESKTIRSASYAPWTRLMIVTFQAVRGSKPVSYLYDGVPPAMWEEFYGAASKGGFFTARIRPLYAGKKVEE